MKTKHLIREKFRTDIFRRDGNRCKVCKKTESIVAHHITDRNEIPNGGYVVENGITLCPDCHMMAEEYHISRGTRWFHTYLPDELYALIGESRYSAFKAAKK